MAESSSLQQFTLFPLLPREIRLLIWEAALPGPRIVNIFERRLKTSIGQWEENNSTTWPPPTEISTSGGQDEDSLEYHGRWNTNVISGGFGRWKMSRGVANTFKNDHYDNDIEDLYKMGHLVGLTSTSPAPEILYVCHEAYDVVTTTYVRTFSTSVSIPQTWFNFEKDVLYISYENFSCYFQEDGLSGIMFGLGGSVGVDKKDLDRVQNLAILLDNAFWAEYMNDSGASLRWLSTLLRNFTALKDFTLVLWHHKDEADDQSPIHFTKVYAVDDFVATYRKFLSDPSIPFEEWPHYSDYYVEHMTELRQEMLHNFIKGSADGGGPHLTLEHVRDRVAVNGGLKMDLDAAMQLYEGMLRDRMICSPGTLVI